MSRFVPVSLALCAALAAAPAPADDKDKPENLLVNGSFEDGPEPGEFVPLDKGSTDIKGWEVTRGQIDYIGSYWKAADGKRSIDLHGSPGLGGVKQTFKTTKGQKYKVTLSLAVNPDSTKKTKKVAVEAAGQKKEFELDGADKTREEMGWQTKTWGFTADGAETTLEVYTLETEDEACGPALDNVSVVAAK
jgi:choice-of-anchor C domain-containing protein